MVQNRAKMLQWKPWGKPGGAILNWHKHLPNPMGAQAWRSRNRGRRLKCTWRELTGLRECVFQICPRSPQQLQSQRPKKEFKSIKPCYQSIAEKSYLSQTNQEWLEAGVHIRSSLSKDGIQVEEDSVNPTKLLKEHEHERDDEGFEVDGTWEELNKRGRVSCSGSVADIPSDFF